MPDNGLLRGLSSMKDNARPVLQSHSDNGNMVFPTHPKCLTEALPTICPDLENSNLNKSYKPV